MDQKLFTTLDVDEPPYSISFSPSGTKLMVGFEKLVEIYDFNEKMTGTIPLYLECSVYNRNNFQILPPIWIDNDRVAGLW